MGERGVYLFNFIRFFKNTQRLLNQGLRDGELCCLVLLTQKARAGMCPISLQNLRCGQKFVCMSCHTDLGRGGQLFNLEPHWLCA